MVLVLVLGCGRIGFPDLPSDAASPPDVPDDELPLPDGVCQIARLSVGPTPARADLAIAATKDGYLAIWVDADRAAPAHAISVSQTFAPSDALELPFLTASSLSGILEVERAFVIVSAVGTTEAVHAVSKHLESLGPPSSHVDAVATRDPFALDPLDGSDVLVQGSGGNIDLSTIGPDGGLTLQRSGVVYQAKQELACSRGTSSGQGVWSQSRMDAGAPRECWAAPVDRNLSGELQIGSADHMPDVERCDQMRAAAMPDESSIGVWSTDGAVQARYLSKAGDLARTISPAGSAPKVVSDGSRFLIAWLEPAGGLQLTSFGLNGTLVTRPLAAWRPAGAEAFELVHRGNETVLAALADGKLALLTLCP